MKVDSGGCLCVDGDLTLMDSLISQYFHESPDTTVFGACEGQTLSHNQTFTETTCQQSWLTKPFVYEQAFFPGCKCAQAVST